MKEDYLIKGIRKTIEEKVNEEYTNIKEQALQSLDTQLELNRNAVLKEILDTISIDFSQQYEFNMPVINIKIIR